MYMTVNEYYTPEVLVNTVQATNWPDLARDVQKVEYKKRKTVHVSLFV